MSTKKGSSECLYIVEHYNILLYIYYSSIYVCVRYRKNNNNNKLKIK